MSAKPEAVYTLQGAASSSTFIYNTNMNVRGGGERVCAALAAQLSISRDVVLVTNERVDLHVLEKYFAVDLQHVKQLALAETSRLLRAVNVLPIPRSIRSLLADKQATKMLPKLHPHTFINNSYRSLLPNLGQVGIYMCMFPHRLRRNLLPPSISGTYQRLLRALDAVVLRRRPVRDFSELGYDVVTANSMFTKRYIGRYWSIDALLLYPPCTSMREDGIDKERVILNVGRFEAPGRTAHHKRQDALIDAFAKMGPLHDAGWRLHLAGSRGRGRASRNYLSQLQDAARGLPIEFHIDTPYGKLRSLYNRASVYWHATGYGDEDESRPETHEHFGMTTVEALSAGCIAVAYDSAGQRECVIPGQNGYLWRTQDHLATIMREIAAMDDGARSSFQAQAIRSAERFSERAFQGSVDAMLGTLQAARENHSA